MQLIKRLSLVLVAIALLTALVLHYGKQPQPFAEGSLSAAMLAPGPYAVASVSERLIDNSRGTQANGDVAAIDARFFDTTIWYPSDNDEVLAGQHPLVIYSHGFSSMKEGGSHLGEYLASHGYIVVAADYPLTHLNTNGGPMVQDVANQPGDVSFLIDTLLGWSISNNHRFSNRIDAQRIAATGISLGGMTTTLVAFHPEKRDPRIKIAASIAGPLAMFGPAFFSFHSMPFMMLATEQDALVDYQTNARPVLERISGAQLVTIQGASHTGFSEPAKYFRWLHNPDSVGCKVVLENIDLKDDERWYDLLGTPEQGILQDPAPPFCTLQPLPPAMNVLRQHMLTKVAIFSFFQSHFAEDEKSRATYARYLASDMTKELADIRYEVAP